MACSKYASIYASNKQTTNAARVSRLLLDPCTDMLRDVLRQYIPETSFPGKLQSETLNIKPLLNASQREMLYPKNGTFTGSYQDFDISLLYLLLRNISGITQHTKGWGKTPIAGDRSISANIERIRNIRNTYIGHINQSSMSDSQFNSVWQEVRNIASELVKDVGLTTDYVGLIDRLEHEPMDPELEQAYLQKLNDTEQTIADLKGEQDKQTQILRKHDEVQTKHGATLTDHEDRLNKQGEVQSKLGATLTDHEERLNKQGEVQSKLGATLTDHEDRLNKQGKVQSKLGATLEELEVHLTRHGEVQTKHWATLTEHEDRFRKGDEVQTKYGATLTEHEYRLNRQAEVQTKHGATLTEQEERLTKQGATIKEYEKRFIKQEEVQDKEATNILDSTTAVLQNHKSCKTYIRTKQVDTVVQKLHEQHIVILTEKPGDGKTTIAKQVLCELSNDRKYLPVIMTKPDQWDKVVNPYQKIIVYIDDIFGSTNVVKSAVDDWINMFESRIPSASEGKILVLISSRSTVLAEVRKSFEKIFLSHEYEINLASNVLTEKEKEDMLFQYESVHVYRTSELIGNEFREYELMHGKDTVYTLRELERNAIVKSEPYYGFPQTCFLFFARKEFFQLGRNFFLRPNKTLFENVENMRKSTDVRIKMQYCALAYIFLQEDVHLWDIKEDIFQEICEKSNLPKMTEADVEDAVQDLVGIYLSPSNHTHVFTFCHVTIREAVAASFGKLAPDIVIQKCSDEILLELIRTEGYLARDGEVILTIRKKYYPLLANRLLTEDTTYGIYYPAVRHPSVFHPATDDAEFTPVLIDVINKSSHNSRAIIKQIWDSFNCSDKPVLYREILTRHGPHHTKHKAEYDSDVSVDEHDSDMSVESPYLITHEEVKRHLDDHLIRGYKQTAIVIIRYVISNCDVNYFLNSNYFHACTITGMSVIHCCVARGWTDVVDEILNAVTPTKTKNNWSCLHFSALFGRFELFKKFEKLSSNVLETTREGYNILQVVLLGLRHGMYRTDYVPKYYLSVSDNDNWVYFSNISEHETDFINNFQHVMTGYPSFITSIDMPLDDYNNNIIHYLVIYDRQEIYDMLIEKKNDLIFNRNETELPTTLHVAAYLGRVKFVEKLWKAGVRAEVADQSIAKCIESGQEHSGKTVSYAFSYLTMMNQWRDERFTVINNIKLKCVREQSVRFGCIEDYTAISSICSACN